MRGAFWLWLAVAASCSKPEEKPRRTEPWPAPASASSESPAAPAATRRRYRFSPDSRVHFTIAGKRGSVSGHFIVAQGRLELDPREPKATRASAEVDLTTLTIDTQPPETLDLGAPPSTIGLHWLELGADVRSERREQFKLARFELSSLDGPTAQELATRRRSGHTRVTAMGTLTLHGFRSPVRLELLITGGGRERLSIRSATPLVIPLATHDITARGASGIADTLGAARAAPWVGKNAQVTLELFAEPEPAAP